MFGSKAFVVYFAPNLLMNTKQLTYCLLSIILFSSCSQFKSLTSRDNSATTRPVSKSKSKNVQFLDDISVTPGQEVTSRHSTIGATATRPKKAKNAAAEKADLSGSDIERASWLQLKYAIMLDATVENLSNVSLLKLIDEWWGTRYCMGGSTKNCIDCSAFVQVIMTGIYGISLPRTAQEQFNTGNKIGMEDLQEGDLVFFHTSGRTISHVGIYMLNNKFVHASTSGGVMFNDLNDGYWREKFRGATRMTDNSTAGTR